MSIEDRITQALAARPYLDRSDIEACARRMMAAERVGQTSILGHELNRVTCVPVASPPSRFRSHPAEVAAHIAEAAGIAANLYTSAVIAALVTANVHESELRARGAHWVEGEWTDPLAVLSHIAGLAITHPKVKAFSVNVCMQTFSLSSKPNEPSSVKSMIELRITRTK